MKTAEQVSQEIIRQLNITDPALSLEIGSVERKIIDAVAEVVSESYVDFQLSSRTWDLDSKLGVELDELVSLFGFKRMDGKRSKGEVTITLISPAPRDLLIPVGTVFYRPKNDTLPQINYVTTAPALIPKDRDTVTVPVECTIAGSVGNTPPGTIIGSQSLNGVQSVTNKLATVGGMDLETDEALRGRFRRTFLKNLAGTADFYAGLLLQIISVNRVNVLGPLSRFYEQLQVKDSVAVSTVPSSKYTYPLGEFVSIQAGTPNEVYFRRGVDYTLDYTVPPKVKAMGSRLIEGTIFELEHEFCSSNSRNDPEHGLTNKVDLFVNGQDPLRVKEVGRVDLSRKFVSEAGELNIANFLHLDGTPPTVGHVFQQLGYAPVLSPPEFISYNEYQEVDPTTVHVITQDKKLGTDYLFVYGTTLDKGSSREVCGLEWINPPGDGQQLFYYYTQNRTPDLGQSIIEANRQITTDALVHACEYVNLTVNMIVVANPGQSITQLQDNIGRALTYWLETLKYRATIQLSDVEAVVHAVPGVDACRIPREDDTGITTTGIEELFADGKTLKERHFKDFTLRDNQLPRLADLNIIQRSLNTFGRQ